MPLEQQCSEGRIVKDVRTMQMRGSAPLEVSICKSGSLHHGSLDRFFGAAALLPLSSLMLVNF